MNINFPTLVDEVLDQRHDSDAVAVVDLATGDQVTYRTLARRTQVLTDLLARHGIGRHGTVAMIMDKSVDSIVCMWATLRLGARYVPIDESLPPARVAVMLGKCQPAVTVVHPSYRDLAACAQAGTVLIVDGWHGGGDGFAWDPAAESGYRKLERPDRDRADHAYVIFTSGSTGTPKGVVISHRSVCSLLSGVQRVVGFQEGMRYLNVAPLFFDASVVDLYSTFLVGGTVHLLPRLRMAGQVTAVCEEWRITDTLLVPSVIRMLVGRFSDIDRRDLSSLRRVWFGGESCPVSLLRLLDKKVPGLTYVHGYGPTETTHSATLYLTQDIASHDGEFLPIGRPLPGVDTKIVDDELRPVPAGETGELLIGGPQVMAGYCADEEATRKALVRLGTTLDSYYRSGDFVKCRDDGELVFIGRRDDAVKISGNLVHLSEVEAATLSAEWVSDCFAIAADHPVTGRAIRLFVLGSGDDLGGTDHRPLLRRELAALLPPYMVPAEIIMISEGDVSLTPAGKLDRNQLRAYQEYAP